MRRALTLVLAASTARAQPLYVGDAGPAAVAAAAADGSWVVLCQARQDTDHDGVVVVRSGGMGGTYGDQQDTFLVVEAGAGTAIDDVVAVDPSGQRVVIERAHRLVLARPTKPDEVDLTRLGARSPLFDDTGTHLIYIR
jgi:hypothetical protein